MIAWRIEELLPHAGDMLLIDAVHFIDEENVQATVRIRPHGLFSQADGSMPAWVGIELMAQTIAAYAGYHLLSAGQPIELGFLLGTRNYQCSVERFPVDSVLQLKALRTLEDESGMGMFECHIDAPGIHAEARLNVFRPPNVASYLKEPES
ncbi:ApeP family dehydratase [Pseudomonas sp. LRF_L74]|uniref:ApeP family dehydratase n=1 Tax=Pseudomonas sp. LRF_L74 TaxID=3369422 RepID=UPI003F62F8D2